LLDSISIQPIDFNDPGTRLIDRRNKRINARVRIRSTTRRLINIFHRTPVDSELTLIDVGMCAGVERKPRDAAWWPEQSGIVDSSICAEGNNPLYPRYGTEALKFCCLRARREARVPPCKVDGFDCLSRRSAATVSRRSFEMPSKG